MTEREGGGRDAVWHESDRYRVRLARDSTEIRRAQVLRFVVFNKELREGLPESWARGFDEDAFDAPCDHLIVELVDSGEIVGTYRVQPTRRASGPPGLYTAGEFDLSPLAPLLPHAVETGRACIHAEHRNTRVLQLLWQGLGSYMLAHGARFLFGCCSLTSQDPADGMSCWRWLHKHEHLHPSYAVRPRLEYRCFPQGAALGPGPVARGVPPLFAAYLKIGTKIAGEPAIDRQFKTIDFLALLDLNDLSESNRRRFLATGD